MKDNKEQKGSFFFLLSSFTFALGSTLIVPVLGLQVPQCLHKTCIVKPHVVIKDKTIFIHGVWMGRGVMALVYKKRFKGIHNFLASYPELWTGFFFKCLWG